MQLNKKFVQNENELLYKPSNLCACFPIVRHCLDNLSLLQIELPEETKDKGAEVRRW